MVESQNFQVQKVRKEFERLYREFSDPIFRHCYFRVFDRERAQDLMQEVFVRVWRYIADGNKIEQPRAFIYRVAHNLIINDITRRKEVLSLDNLREKGFDISVPDDKKMQVVADANMILKIIEDLDPNIKDMVLMRFVDDLKPSEIAEALNLSANVVSVRLNRAMTKIRDLIGDITRDE